MAIRSKTNRNNRKNVPETNSKEMPNGTTKSNVDYESYNDNLKEALNKLNLNIQIAGETELKRLREEEKHKEENQSKLEELKNEMLKLTYQYENNEITRANYDLQLMEKQQKIYEIQNEQQIKENEEHKKQMEEMKKSFEEKDKKVKDFFQGAVKNINKVIDKNSTALRGAFLGPINLLISPFEEFFGGSIFNAMKGMFTKGKDFIKKLTKKHPNETDLLKNHEYTGIYVIDKLKDLLGKANEQSLSAILPAILSRLVGIGKSIFGIFSFLKKGLISLLQKSMGKLGLSFAGAGKGGGALGGLTGSGAKAFGIGSIIAGLIMMIKDGIKAVIEDKFGASKISTFIGGFFGGLDSGVKGAFSNMGKWALLGAGIGSVVPVVGTILGGLIGAGIGALLGAIGGQRIAKGFDIIGKWFKENVFPIFIEYFKSIIEPLKKIGFIWKGEGSIGKKIGGTVRQIFISVFNLLFGPFKVGKKLLDLIGKSIIGGTSKLGSKLKDIFGKFIEKIFEFFKGKSLVDIIKDGIMNYFKTGFKVWDTIIGFVWDFFAGIFDSTLDWETAKKKMKDVLDEYLIDPIKNFFYTISDAFDFFKDHDFGALIDLLRKGELLEEIKKHHENKTKERLEEKMKKEGKKVEPPKPTTPSVDDYRAMYGPKTTEKKVDDAIIKSDGTIIRTSVDDNIIATKNMPQKLSSVRIDNQKDLNNNLKYVSSGSDMMNKMDKIINVLSSILDKDINVVLPSQTRSDLVCLIGGRNA